MLKECDYCNYETCFALEELGFPLHPYGNTEIDTSLRLTLLYEAQKWLREERKVVVVVIPSSYDCFAETNRWAYEIWRGDNLEREVTEYNSYEEALLEGIKEAIKLLMGEK